MSSVRDIRSQRHIAKTFFDNLLTPDELLAAMKNRYAMKTVYKWVHQGMPCKKIRGKLWFDLAEVTDWLQRSS